MSIKALQKPFTKDGGVYQDAVHRIVDMEVTAYGVTSNLFVTIATYGNMGISDENGSPAQLSTVEIDLTDPNVEAGLGALRDAVYAQIKERDLSLKDAIKIVSE